MGLNIQSIAKVTNTAVESTEEWSIGRKKTLEVMKKTKSWEKITKIGEEIQESWKKIAEKNGLDINISGQPAISSFSFNSNSFFSSFLTG